MLTDLNNDAQDAGIAASHIQESLSPIQSEFYQVVAQDSDGSEKTFNYRSDARVYETELRSFEEGRDLSAPELQALMLSGEDGMSAEDIVQEEYKKNSNDGREQAILLEAMKFGSQSAILKRTTKYRKMLIENKHELSRIFNFAPLLLLDGRVVPPIISESSNLSVLEDRYTKRTVKKSYKIIEQARVMNTPLDWRTYLLTDVQKPMTPSVYALPIKNNKRELEIWANGYSQGWEAGLKLANDVIIQNIRSIERDYIGMIRYKLMRLKGMITSPLPSNVKLGVTGDVDTLNIGESIFEIVKDSTFNRNSESWNALPEIESPITFN